MSEQQLREINAKLERVVELLEFNVALDLARSGVPQAQIKKKLSVGSGAIAKMLNGAKVQNGG
jgi:hypothetical protein